MKRPSVCWQTPIEDVAAAPTRASLLSGSPPHRRLRPREGSLTRPRRLLRPGRTGAGQAQPGPPAGPSVHHRSAPRTNRPGGRGVSRSAGDLPTDAERDCEGAISGTGVGAQRLRAGISSVGVRQRLMTTPSAVDARSRAPAPRPHVHACGTTSAVEPPSLVACGGRRALWAADAPGDAEVSAALPPEDLSHGLDNDFYVQPG
jgi:hypothetical protein